MFKLKLPSAGGELVPDIRVDDLIKAGPDAAWTRRQPLVDVSKVKPEAGTEIVTSESAGFWWVLSPHREEDGLPNLFVMNDTAFRQAFYCVAVGPDAPWNPPLEFARQVRSYRTRMGQARKHDGQGEVYDLRGMTPEEKQAVLARVFGQGFGHCDDTPRKS